MLGSALILCGSWWRASKKRNIESRGLRKVANAPHVVCDPGFHGGRAAQLLLNAAEVLEREPDHNSGPVVLTSWKGIGQPGEAVDAHSQAAIQSRHDAIADVFPIGATHEPGCVRTSHQPAPGTSESCLVDAGNARHSRNAVAFQQENRSRPTAEAATITQFIIQSHRLWNSMYTPLILTPVETPISVGPYASCLNYT